MIKILDAIRWKSRQKYSQMRCFWGSGYYCWEVENGVRFLSCSKSAFSHVLYVCKGHEKVEMEWCRRWIEIGGSGQVIIDCGANIGYFSAILAQNCDLDEILAVEGNKPTAEICKPNLYVLGIKNIKVINAILASDPLEKYIIPDMPGKEPWQRAIKTDSPVNGLDTTTLDNLIAEFNITPTLVKIDCEGFETLILKGATYLLDVMRPAFMIECDDNALMAADTSRKELFDLIRSFKYKLFHLASFTGSHPFGVEIDEKFPATEFNFAAISEDSVNLDRWERSIHSPVDKHF